MKRLYSFLMTHKWELGLVQNGIEGLLNGERPVVKWIHNPYKDRWFADPFILSVDKEYLVLLVEEYSYKRRVGRIAEIKVSLDTYKIIGVKIILELDSHLSFPAIIRDKDRIFIYPENSTSGKLNLYEYNEKDHSVSLLKEILGRPLTDAILYKSLKGLYIFSTEIPTQNGNVLSVYHSENDIQSFHKISDVTFKENIARNAGDVFEFDGKLFRPAQECNQSYGHAVSLQQMVVDNNNIKFEEKIRLLSPNKKYNLGFHTFNVYNNFIVVDAMAFRYYYIAKLLRWLVSGIKKMLR